MDPGMQDAKMRNAKCKLPNAKCNIWSRGIAVTSAVLFARLLRVTIVLYFAFCILHSGPVAAQQLLDRIVARVNGTEITQTDLQAARGLGVVSGANESEALQRLIERQLLLTEVSRFPPPDPPQSAVDTETARQKAAAGTRLPEIMTSTGTDEARIREMARDTLRLDAYIDQRFGTSMQVTDDEAAAYYGAHQDEFRRNGVVIPFEEALPVARERASGERRRTQVERWVIDLRGRADIAIPTAVAGSW
jgi:hypothetical protein